MHAHIMCSMFKSTYVYTLTNVTNMFYRMHAQALTLAVLSGAAIYHAYYDKGTAADHNASANSAKIATNRSS